MERIKCSSRTNEIIRNDILASEEETLTQKILTLMNTTDSVLHILQSLNEDNLLYISSKGDKESLRYKLTVNNYRMCRRYSFIVLEKDDMLSNLKALNGLRKIPQQYLLFQSLQIRTVLLLVRNLMQTDRIYIEEFITRLIATNDFSTMNAYDYIVGGSYPEEQYNLYLQVKEHCKAYWYLY